MIEILSSQFNPTDMNFLLTKTLPDQGSVEVQRDVAGKEHFWHTHESDETILVLHGTLRFYWEEGEQICRPGDVVSLPAGTRHGSEAEHDGATYLIAFHKIQF